MQENTAIKGIGHRIRDFRLKLKLSQAELAERAGVSKSTVFRAEAGHQDLNYKLLFCLVWKFGIDPNWLVLGEESGRSMWGPELDQIVGHHVKHRPEALHTIPAGEGGQSKWYYFPMEADPGLVRLVKRLEELYLRLDNSGRESLRRLLDAVGGFRAAEAQGEKKLEAG